MDILAITMQKGGTGKTTTAATLAQAAAYKGKKALLIDLDPQADLTFIMGADMALQGSYELLNGAAVEDTIQNINKNLDIIAASADLAALTSEKGSANRLRVAIEPIQGKYDIVLIDVSPTAGELQYNALMAATGVVIPLQADSLNLKNLQLTINTIRAIQEKNNSLQIKGILFTANSERTTIARQMQDSLIADAAERQVNYLGDVRKCVAIKEAQAMQQSLYDYAPKSTAAADYLSILTRISKKYR
jgi:chromosome partitioning protein